MDKKHHDLTTGLGIQFKYNDRSRLKVNEWKKIYYTNDQKNTVVDKLTSDNIDFRAKTKQNKTTLTDTHCIRI